MCIEVYKDNHTAGNIAGFLQMFPDSLPYIPSIELLNQTWCLCSVDVKDILGKLGYTYHEDFMGDLLILESPSIQ